MSGNEGAERPDDPARNPSPEEATNEAADESADESVAADPLAGQRASPKLLESLVCPATGARLEYDAGRGELISRNAGLAYPIRSGIPIMLIDEARKIET